MKSPFAAYKTNEQEETGGKWIDFDGYSFCIRRIGATNKPMQAYMEQAMRPYKQQIKNKTMPDDVAQDITLQAFCRHCLVNWSTTTDGVESIGIIVDNAGEEIGFSVENAIKVMKALPDLFDELTQLAQDHETFLAASETETAKK